MTEFLKVFESTAALTVHQVGTFVLLIVPGFVSLRVYEFKRGDAARKAADVIVDLVVYSLASDALVLGGLELVSQVTPSSHRLFFEIIILVVGLLLIPSAFAVAFLALQTWLIGAGIGSAVDSGRSSNVIRSASQTGTTPGVILTLQDGRKVGGRARNYGYGAIRAAAGEEDIIVDEVWTVDQQQGMFVARVPGSIAMAVPKSEYRTIRSPRASSGRGR